MKVAFIAGMGRSGSTVLDRYLGAQPGFQSLGEVPTVWSGGVLDNNLCSCGEPFRDCSFWGRVVGEDPQIFTRDVARMMSKVHQQVLPVQQIPRLWFRATRLKSVSTLPPIYFSVLDRFYSAVQRATGAIVLVDSTKGPAYLSILDQLGSVDSYVIHLIRDPRAVAYSWARLRRTLTRPDEDLLMRRYGPVASSVFWIAMNLSTSKVLGNRNHLRLRYEDFVARPERIAERIRAGLGVDAMPGRNSGDYHTLGGNPSRFTHGPIHLKLDSEWVHQMPASHAWTTTVMTMPWLFLYGYPVKPRSPSLETRN